MTDLISEHYFLLAHPVIWAICLITILCYARLLDLCFFKARSHTWLKEAEHWQTPIKIMLSSLPLLGLLGTISGLLKTFSNMALQQGFAVQETISGGIAEAMFTTQLGLLMVIPGLLLLTKLNSRITNWLMDQTNEKLDRT